MQLKTFTNEPTKPNEANKPEKERKQTKFTKPDEQFLVVELETGAPNGSFR